MEISEAELERANRRMAKRRVTEPFAVAASFDEQRRMIAVSLNNGVEVKFPADKMQGLSGAKPEHLAEIEISPAGYGLHFPKLDADFSLPGLLAGVFRHAPTDGSAARRRRWKIRKQKEGDGRAEQWPWRQAKTGGEA